MKLPDALRGIVLLGIDSAPLIYLVEQHPTYGVHLTLCIEWANFSNWLGIDFDGGVISSIAVGKHTTCAGL